MRCGGRVFNVRKHWPSAPKPFTRAKIVSLGRKAERSSRYVVNNGLSFQRRLTNVFEGQKEWLTLSEVGFAYLDGNGEERRAYVDIVLINPRDGLIVVVEAKRTHTPDSYKQIWFYMGLLQSRFGGTWKVFGVEACSLAGRSAEYPGECVWGYGGEFDLKSIEWSGEGAPKVGILPCYLTYEWSVKYG